MLPQIGSSPMDSSPNSPIESTLPPDICLKSSKPGKNLTIHWQSGQDEWSTEHSNSYNMEEAEEMSCVGHQEPIITCTDLLQSSSAATENEDDRSRLEALGSLPDLCEGAQSLRESSVIAANNIQAIQNRHLPEICDQTTNDNPSTSTVTPSHEGRGAKPKVFKYRVGSKSRSDSERRSNNNSGTKVNSKLGRTSPSNSILTNNHSDDKIYKTNCDGQAKSNTKQLSIESAETDDQVTVDSYEKSFDNSLMINKMADSRSVGDGVLDQSADHISTDGAPVEELMNTDQIEDDPCSSLMEEYLFYDSRPISLVACGVWDCDSRDVPDPNTDATGLVLVRNNLHSASHPMFTKWPCHAYIPAHILVEVAFNSHGTSLGTAAVCHHYAYCIVQDI